MPYSRSQSTHRTWMPDIQDLRKYDDVVFPIPETFYDSYQGRKAAQVQDMTIRNTMQMSYDLKMYSEDTKDGNITRMNDNQRKDFL